jgi:hypothetical protein
MVLLAVQLGLAAFMMAMAGMTYMIFQTFKFYQIAQPMRAMGLGFLWIGISNMMLFVDEFGIAKIGIFSDISMIFAALALFYGIIKYMHAGEIYRDRFTS